MVSIDTRRCIGCGRCVADCVNTALVLEEGTARYTGECIHCGHCVAVCPAGAVALPDYDMAEVAAQPPRPAADIHQLLALIKHRRSIRQFRQKPVEREKLEAIVQAGRYTPTGGNRQDCRFLVVQQELETLKGLVWQGVAEAVQTPPKWIPEEIIQRFQGFVELRESGTDFLFRNAPAVLYVAAESTVDAALAAQSMELAAVAQGLGALYNGFLVMATAGTPAACGWMGAGEKRIRVCMLLGYPDVEYRRSAPKKPADVRWL